MMERRLSCLSSIMMFLQREWGMSYDSLFALSIPMAVLFGAAALVAGDLAAWLGWRAAFIAPGILCILCGFGFLFVCRAGWIVDPTAARSHDPAAIAHAQ